MNLEDLRKKETKEIQEILTKLNKEVIDSYLEMRSGKLKDVRKPRRLRRDIAAILTVLGEKERTEQNKGKKEDKLKKVSRDE